MRDVSSLTTEIGTNLGTEPINILKVEWAAGTVFYSDKTMGSGTTAATALGLIKSLGSLSSQLDSINQAHNNSITVTLLGGSLTSAGGLLPHLAVENFYKIPCTLMQAYDSDGLGTISATVDILKGYIQSPITWSESTNTITFTVSTTIEEKFIGYTPKKEDYKYASSDLGDRTWPLCFGKVLRVPAVKVTNTLQGSTLEDFTSDELESSASGVTIKVDNGKDFEQGTTLSLVIDGLDFDGSFSNDTLTLESPLLPKFTSVSWAARSTTDLGKDSYRYAWIAQADYDAGVRLQGLWCIRGTRINFCVSQKGTRTIWRYAWEAKLDNTDTDITEASAFGFADWGWRDVGMLGPSVIASTQVKAQTNWQIPSGSKVFISGEETSVAYIANIDSSAASDVVEVMGYRQINGRRQLVSIPNSYYTVEKTYDPTAELDSSVYDTSDERALIPTVVLAIVFDNDLSFYRHEQWEDDVFVSFQSKTDGNVAAVIDFLLTNYSDMTLDATSKTDADLVLVNHDLGFAITSKENTLATCRELAFQSGYGLYVDYDTVYLKPILGDLETSGLTALADADINLDTIVVAQTDYFDIQTELKVNYNIDYIKKPAEKVYEDNKAIYGPIEVQENFWSFNNVALIDEIAPAWLYRFARSWRILSFETYLNSLEIEIFDFITVTLSDDLLDIDSGVMTGMVRGISHNTGTGKISIEMWLPVVSGTNTEDTSAWLTYVGDTTSVIAGLATSDYEIEQLKTGFTKSHGAFSGGGGGSPAEDELVDYVEEEFEVDAGGSRLAITQAAAGTGTTISVKLTNSSGAATGAAFNATGIFTDGSTNMNDCLPDVGITKKVIVAKLSGTWYIVNPTFTGADSSCP